MAKIGVFVERYIVSNSVDMNALMRFGQVARRMGHRTDFLFRPDMYKIPEYDAIFIRALTDPLNSSYVAARTAEMHGIRVVDDPDSIVICCDKINMYRRLIKAGVKIPETVFIDELELNRRLGSRLLDEFGSTLVLKAPNTSFSMYVDRVSSPVEFVKVGKKFLRRADRIVVQRFVQSQFDWRVGVLGGEPIYVCQYLFARKQWKIHAYLPNGKSIYGPVKGIPLEKADPQLIRRAVEAAGAIGNGLYGVDLKQTENDYIVIEVNDNPTIAAGEEDQKAGGLYEKLVNFLINNNGSPE